MKMTFFTLIILTFAALAFSLTGYSYTSTYATCTGSRNCKACKNCKYCKHCAKDGGFCGVCK